MTKSTRRQVTPSGGTEAMNAKSLLVPAVGYLRRSTGKQEKSIPDQRREISRFAEEQGYEMIRWYVDDAISGDATPKRDEFLRMRDDSASGEFRAIICWDQERFGRFDSLDAGYWIKPIRDAGVQLVLVSEGVVNWNDFTGRVMYGLKQEGKNQYLRDLSRNTARGLISSAQQGYSCGQAAPYGFDRMIVDQEGNHQHRVRTGEKYIKPRGWHVTFVPSDDPEKLETAKWLFATYANTDLGLRALADQLNERGVPGPTGGAWYAASIREMLKNDKYIGDVSWAKRREGKYHRVAGTHITERDKSEIQTNGNPQAIDNPPEAWIGKSNAHEALIDRDTFDRVQAKLHRRRRRQPKGEGFPYPTHTRANREAYQLTGLVYCGHCGCKMHGATCVRKKKNKTYRYPKYVCSTYCRSGKNNDSGCGYHNVQQSVLVDVLLRKIRETFLCGENSERLAAEIKRRLTARAKPDGKLIANLKRRLQQLEQDISRAADRLLRAPEDLLDVLAPKLTAMKSERDRVVQMLNDAKAATQPKDIEATTKAIIDRLWRLDDELKNAPPARLRELLHSLVQRIELRFDRVPRGKRVECPLVAGEIHFRTDSEMFGSVSRGEPVCAELDEPDYVMAMMRLAG